MFTWHNFILCGILVMLSSVNVFAAGSGAFRVETPDAGAMGKGSAFVGEANTPAAVFYNPAGLSQLTSSQISLGMALISPHVDYKNNSGNETQMRRNSFLVPNVYLGVPVSNKFVFGLGATSYFGTGTEWAADSFSKYVATESNLENKDYMLTLTYKVTDQWSFAAGVDNDQSKANKKKKLAQASGTDGDFELNAKSMGWGYRLATMYKLNDRHQFGLMYRSPIRHKYRGKAYLDGLDTSLTVGPGAASYQGVFGGSSFETEFSQEFVLPQSIVLGYSFKPVDRWTLNADIEWMDWGSVEQDRINWENNLTGLQPNVLNDGNPASRDWTSVISFALGAEFAATEKLKLRGGYYHHQTPIPESNWESSLPDSDSNGFTLGFGYALTEKLTLDLAYSGLIFKDRKIENNTAGSASGANINGTYEQYISMVLGSVSYKF